MNKNKSYINHYISYLKTKSTQKQKNEDEVWAKINENIKSIEKKKHRRKLFICISSIAAVIASLIFILDLKDYTNNTSANTSQNVELILASGKHIKLESNNIHTTYHVKQQPIINNMPKNDVIEYETLIVPKGKICNLILSDGSSIHINANSSVRYQKKFTGNKRMIQIEGEVYCDIKKIEGSSFLVKTDQFKIEVLGTKFNVNAYKSADLNSVILVSGSIKLIDKKTNTLLKPDQMALLDNGQLRSLHHVNTDSYTSWINGRLTVNQEKLSLIFSKLEQFYDTKIHCDTLIAAEIFNGKIDLTQPLESVIKSIQFATHFKYTQSENGEIYISNH